MLLSGKNWIKYKHKHSSDLVTVIAIQNVNSTEIGILCMGNLDISNSSDLQTHPKY